MSFINHHTKQVYCKILYAGPLGSGKTTNLQWISHRLNKKDTKKNEKYEQNEKAVKQDEKKSEEPFFQLPANQESSELFDFLPLSIGKVHDFHIRLHLYTFPASEKNPIAKQILLKGVDGLVFVADSQLDRLDANLQSMKELQESLILHGVRLKDLPVILQYNKRDLTSIASLTDLRSYVNLYSFREVEAKANKGVGVGRSLKSMTQMLLTVLKGGELY